MRRRRRFALGAMALFAVAAIGGEVAARRAAAGPVVATIALRTMPEGTMGSVAIDPQTEHAFVLATNPDGTRGYAHTIDVRTGALITTTAVGSGLPIIGPTGLSVDERTGHVLEVNEDTTVTMLDARSGRAIETSTVTNGLAQPIAIVTDAARQRAYVLGNGGAGRVLVLDTRSGRRVRTIPIAGFPLVMAEDVRNGHLFVSGLTRAYGNARGNGLLILDGESGRVLHSFGVGGPVAIDARTGLAFMAAPPGLIALGADSGRIMYRVTLRGAVSAIDVDERTGRVILVDGRREGYGTMTTLDARSGRVLVTTGVGWNPGALALDERRGRVFVANAGTADKAGNPTGDGSISVLNARSGRLARTIPVGGSPAAMAVDPNGGRLVVASRVYTPCSGAGGPVAHTLLGRIRGILSRILNPIRHPTPCGLAGSISVIDPLK